MSHRMPKFIWTQSAIAHGSRSKNWPSWTHKMSERWTTTRGILSGAPSRSYLSNFMKSDSCFTQLTRVALLPIRLPACP